MSIKVVELFAGVGGFRVGLENSSSLFETIWANQWEPGKKMQHAFNCYVEHFGNSPNHINDDIAKVKRLIPNHDLLVGGFPCQDYSVARTGAQGIEGKKGVLWWEINDIVTKKRPKYILLENVDRILKSPAKQRGRDFGIILRCLDDLKYAVEWRVINAAEYGHAQRRRRTFIFAYRNDTPLYNKVLETIIDDSDEPWFKLIAKNGFFAPAFPVVPEHNDSKKTTQNIDANVYADLAAFSNKFSAAFYNSGIMINGKFYTEELNPKKFKPTTLRQIRLKVPVDERYFLNGSLSKWKYLKGSKRIERIKPNGEPYFFSEGGMCFPDNLDMPARTMLTSESSVNRSTHVIEDALTGRLRLLTPEECELINGFPIGWTDTGMPERFRYFTMGNALVVPIITTIGDRILEII